MRYFYEISSRQPRSLVRSSHLHNAIKLRRLWYLNAELCEARFAQNILSTSKLDYSRHKIEWWVGSERLWRHINVTIEFYGDSKVFPTEFRARWEEKVFVFRAQTFTDRRNSTWKLTQKGSREKLLRDFASLRTGARQKFKYDVNRAEKGLTHPLISLWSGFGVEEWRLQSRDMLDEPLKLMLN